LRRSSIEDAAENCNISITLFWVRMIAKPFVSIILRATFCYESFLDST
jgi:hypothetical protein